MTNDTRQFLADQLLEVQRTLGWMDLVIGSIDDAVCVTDGEDKIVFANDCFALLVDVPRIFLLGQKMAYVIDLSKTEKPLAEYRDKALRLSGDGDDNGGIFEWKNKQDKKLVFKVASRLLPGSDQSVYLLQDITHEYELSKVKNNFINLASHQLRTPMTSIMLYSNMLKEGIAGPLNSDQQEVANTIVRSTDRMNRLVNGLLNITRVQSDVAEFKYETISLNAIFKQIMTELGPSIEKKCLKCTIEIPANLSDIKNDPSAVHEIFSNLIVNAVQYTRESGAITISVKKTKTAVIIKVKDTGIGIPKEQQHMLFTQFTRADNALEEFAEGTGLGLYLIKILLDKIGGAIEFTSKLHVGTTFTVTLPIALHA